MVGIANPPEAMADIGGEVSHHLEGKRAREGIFLASIAIRFVTSETHSPLIISGFVIEITWPRFPYHDPRNGIPCLTPYPHIVATPRLDPLP